MPENRLSREGKAAWLTIGHSERLNALTPALLAQPDKGLDAVAALQGIAPAEAAGAVWAAHVQPQAPGQAA
ncbi:hypothetical protein [Pseudooceanicola sp.]|uniref:hypothetical protein n=1 Tax=Pseudooceanicola sp. TaxID=1914328 RepID=UPI002628C4AA|nr:hypothetical protein [Pseudooceanicola sp.]MDF1856441.1 hypothetical protein [Pseudooceanicola sp.]